MLLPVTCVNDTSFSSERVKTVFVCTWHIEMYSVISFSCAESLSWVSTRKLLASLIFLYQCISVKIKYQWYWTVWRDFFNSNSHPISFLDPIKMLLPQDSRNLILGTQCPHSQKRLFYNSILQRWMKISLWDFCLFVLFWLIFLFLLNCILFQGEDCKGRYEEKVRLMELECMLWNTGKKIKMF